MSDIVIFEGDAQPVEVRLEGETLWLTQRQMGELFGTTPENVLMHLRNIYAEQELEEVATAKDFLAVRQEGKRQVKRRLKHYNLDVVISVGYRVNSSRAPRFRQWATRVLREHLTQGYSLNQHRLAQQGLTDLEQAVALLGQTLTRQALVSDLGQEVVQLILGYARTWRLLQDYDRGELGLPAGARPARGILALAEARRALDALGAELRVRGDASELFARDRADGLASILGNLEQSMFGEPLYRNPRGARRAPAVFRDQEPSVLGRQQALRRLSVSALPASGGHAPDAERTGRHRADPADCRERSQGQGFDGAPDHEPDRRSGSDT
jgi:hypothetical protein